MVSGGLDSAYLLRRYLMETDDIVHAHHISMRNAGQARWVPEDAAARSVIKYCEERYRPFGVSESRVDWPFLKHVGWDSDLCIFIGSRVIENLVGDVTLALGWVIEDSRPADAKRRQARGVAGKLWEACRFALDDPEKAAPKIARPLWKKSKKEVVEGLPDDLVKLTWSCRTPVNTQGTWVACGQCHACRVREEALRP